jgi:hypothetical protein
MADKDLRVWFLMRGLPNDQSYVFTNVVAVERSGAGRYTATIAGMDGRILANGRTEDEAADEALDLFKSMIDHCIDAKRPLENVVGTPVEPKNIPLAKFNELYKAFNYHLEELNERHEERAQGESWVSTPQTGYLSMPVEATA